MGGTLPYAETLVDFVRRKLGDFEEAKVRDVLQGLATYEDYQMYEFSLDLDETRDRQDIMLEAVNRLNIALKSHVGSDSPEAYCNIMEEINTMGQSGKWAVCRLLGYYVRMMERPEPFILKCWEALVSRGMCRARI